MELEGLRGIAAIVVALYHNALAFYPLAFFGISTSLAPMQHVGFETMLYGSPFGGLLSGTLSVSIFFVLSGFVLSIGYFQTKNNEVVKKLATKRYLRLMLPALASILICYFLMKLGLSHIQEAAMFTHSGWLSGAWTFTPHLIDAFRDGLLTIFTAGSDPYNNVLWTMTTEFAGSFIVFGFLLLFARSRYRWIGYLILTVILFNTWFAGFGIGMILADLYQVGYLKQVRRSRLMIAGILILGIIFGGYPLGVTQGTIYQVFSYLPFHNLNYQMVSTTIGASLVVGAVLSSLQVSKALQHKKISILGKYTFSLYLIHLPVLYTFTTGTFVLLHHYMGYNKSVALALLLSIPIVWSVTFIFEKYVDKPAIKIASYCAAIYLENRKIVIHDEVAIVKIYIIEKLIAIKRRPTSVSKVKIELE